MRKEKKSNRIRKSSEVESGGNDSLEVGSELRQAVWSVVSFERCVAKNLTYAEAERKIGELEKQRVSGLCVVTDAVAERIAEHN